MSPRLCVLACHQFQGEIAAAIAAEGWPDVVAAGFPARCGRPPLGWGELKALLPEACTQVLLLGSACLSGLGDPPAGFPPLRVLPQDQCFQAVAGPSLVAECLAGGSYMVTPGWLAGWKGRLAEQGFSPDTAAGFFKDFATNLVLFDTGIDPDVQSRLDELARTLGCPARSIAVGLDHVRNLLARVVLEWRLDEVRREGQERDRRHVGERADQVLAMDQLARLAQARQEADAIAIIEELFRMLFAPGAFHYLKLDRGRIAEGGEASANLLADLGQMDGPWAWRPSGFLLRISHGGQDLGLIAVDDLAFPELRERYLNLALAMTGVCGLAIENARTHQRLIEAAKLASLGVLVAGMAHEINTPAGVGLIASSALQERTKRLASRFNERSMTQSDLQAYLETSSAQANLIRTNLERIGQLVEAFRKAVVEGDHGGKGRFRLRACLEDVLASLGGLLSPEHVSLRILCDPNLELDSFPQDWTSIVSNLITNSLRHGFKGRDHGRIEIAVRAGDGRLELDYLDDGVGLSAEARARVFDPFFTTDMQHGMGLGMHRVYNLVTHRLGGSISCSGSPGNGANFHIEVPL